MEVILNTVESNGNVIELVDTVGVDDLPRYTVRALINRKFRFELFETLTDAEVYVEELKKVLYAAKRKSEFRSFAAEFDISTLDN